MKLSLMVVVFALATAIQAQAASQTYCNVVGVRQGRFKGESTSAQHRDAIPILDFAYEVKSPRDPATG